MHSRPLLGLLLLAFGIEACADDPASGPQQRVKTVDTRIIELNERPPNVLREDSAPLAVHRAEPQNTNVLELQSAPDNLKSEEPQAGNIIRFEASPAHYLRSVNKTAAKEEEAPEKPLALRLATALSRPDERPLWHMLERHRHQELLAQLDKLRETYPAWRPPARLVTLAREGALRNRLEELEAAGDAAGIAQFADEQPEFFSCAAISHAWQLAEAQASLGQPERSAAVATRLMSCPKDEDRLATLYKARAWLDARQWENLLAQEEKVKRSPAIEKAFRQLRYDHALGLMLAASEAGDTARTAQLFAGLAPEISARRDGEAALLGAWNHYRSGGCELASTWFDLALKWTPELHAAHQGLALCALRGKRYDIAQKHAEAMPPAAEGRAELLRDAYLGQASAAYAAGRYRQTLDLLDKATGQAELPRYAQMLAAWCHLALGNTRIATEEFTRLYRTAPDQESAQGLVQGMVRDGRAQELENIARDEPLAGLVHRHFADRAYADKRFLAARSLDPANYANRGSDGARQASIAGALRSKSGTPGLSRLDLSWEPSVEAAAPMGTMAELRLRLDRVRLDSGSLPGNAPVGRFPLAPTAYAYAPTTATAGWQPTLLWRDEHRQAWDAQLGLTPSDGAVPMQWTARFATRRRIGVTDVQWRAYREPVRESILSYTGLRDPYQGSSWGRVLRNGVQIGIRTELDEHWVANAQVSTELLTGTHVADNQRMSADAGLGYRLKAAGFDYAVLGISVSTDHYSKNLSQFTLGHGGYFSPQHYWRVGPSLDFMTAENGRFMLRGRISLGRTGKREDAAPLFPLDPDGRTYAESRGAGNAFDIELAGAWRVSDTIQAGALLARRHSPQYNDYAVLGFVRFLFEQRRSVLSSDIRRATSDNLY